MPDYETIEKLYLKKERLNTEWMSISKEVGKMMAPLFLIIDQERDLGKKVKEIKENQKSKLNIFWKIKHKNPQSEIETLESKISKLKNDIKTISDENQPYMDKCRKLSDEYYQARTEYNSMLETFNIKEKAEITLRLYRLKQ